MVVAAAVVAAAEAVAGIRMAAAVVAGIQMAAAVAKWSCCLATVHPMA